MRSNAVFVSIQAICPTVLISAAQTLISCLLLSKTVCYHTFRHIPCDMMVSISCYVINEFQQRVLLRGAKTKSNTGWQDDAGANHHVDSREPGSSGFLCEWFFSLGSQKGSFIPVPPSVLFFFPFFKLFCPYLVKNLQEVTESRLILANCGCACVSEYEREDLRGCQMPRDAAEHVRTREGRGTGKTDRHNASMWRIHIPSA